MVNLIELDDLKRYSCPHKVHIPSKSGQWVKFKDIKEFPKTSHNSDYAMALTVYDEYMEHETTSRYSLPNFREWLKQRLHSNTNVA